MTLWPTLPAEGMLTEVEESFIENSPPDFWPDNQDSNFGQLRRVLTDPLQECIDFLAQLHFEMFVATSSRYLNLWEELVGIPPDPVGLSLDARRALVGDILRKGPFTHVRRHKIIDTYIQIGFGTPIMLVPEGVAIPVEGLPLYGEYDPLSPPFVVLENVETYYYSVRIRNGTTVDDIALTAALEYFQPAGLHFTLDFVPNPLFPLTAILDSFTRADVGPPPSASWGVRVENAGGTMKVVSNRCAMSAANASQAWGTSFAADQEVHVKYVSGASSNDLGVYLRATALNTAPFQTYKVVFNPGTSKVQFWKHFASAWVQIGSDVTMAMNNGDLIGANIVGSTIKAFVNEVQVASVEDTDITGAGSIGLFGGNAAALLDDFGGGSIPVVY